MPPELNLNVAGGPPVEQPNNVVINGDGNHNGNNGNRQPGDRFNGTVAGQLVLNCFNSHLSPFGRSVIELINNNNNGLSPLTRQLLRDLVSSREFRLNMIGDIYGQEAVDRLNRIHDRDDREAEQRETLMALIAIADPAQVIAAINGMKGALLPQLQSLAEGMLEQAWDLGKWLAEKKAKQGDSSYALALYQAGQVGGGGSQSTFSIQTFINSMTSYDPNIILTNAQSTADEANRRRGHQVTVRAAINQLENIVGNSTENNPAVNRARTRLTDLRSIGLG